jgi:hypothetical protein
MCKEPANTALEQTGNVSPRMMGVREHRKSGLFRHPKVIFARPDRIAAK